MGEEGLHRPGQGRHMPHRVTRSRISGLCRGEADDSTHSLRVCQPPVTFPGKWPSSGWYCRYPAGFTRPGGSRCAWSGGFGGVGYCRYPPNTCNNPVAESWGVFLSCCQAALNRPGGGPVRSLSWCLLWGSYGQAGVFGLWLRWCWPRRWWFLLVLL